MLKKKAVPLSKFGIRKKMIPRKDSRPLLFVRGARNIPKAGRIFKKQEKSVYETKDEKHQPETTKSFADIPISKLKTQIGEFALGDLQDLLKDERVSAVRLAKDEIAKREG